MRFDWTVRRQNGIDQRQRFLVIPFRELCLTESRIGTLHARHSHIGRANFQGERGVHANVGGDSPQVFERCFHNQSARFRASRQFGNAVVDIKQFVGQLSYVGEAALGNRAFVIRNGQSRGKTANSKNRRNGWKPISTQEFTSSIPDISRARTNRAGHKVVLQILGKLFHGGVSLLRLFPQSFQEDRFEIALQLRRELGGGQDFLGAVEVASALSLCWWTW